MRRKVARAGCFGFDAQWLKGICGERKRRNVVSHWCELASNPVGDRARGAAGKNIGDDCLIVLHRLQCLLIHGIDTCLRAEQVCSSYLDCRGTQCECGRNTSPVGDSSGCNDWHVHGIDDLRNERHGSDLHGNALAEEHPAMSPCLPALSDNCVASPFLKPDSLLDAACRTEDLAARRLHPADEILPWKAKVEADDFRLEVSDKIAMCVAKRCDRQSRCRRFGRKAELDVI